MTALQIECNKETTGKKRSYYTHQPAGVPRFFDDTEEGHKAFDRWLRLGAKFAIGVGEHRGPNVTGN